MITSFANRRVATTQEWQLHDETPHAISTGMTASVEQISVQLASNATLPMSSTRPLKD